METLTKIIESLAKDWAVLRTAPRSFPLLLLAGLIAGFIASSWYFGGCLETKSVLLEAKESEIKRLRVAVGIDKPSEGALIALTNSEMKAKPATTSAKIRDLYASLQRRQSREDREAAALKTAGKLDEKQAAGRTYAILREVSEEFDRGLRADAINVDNELRRRLGPKAVASIVGLPSSVFSASDGAAIGMLGLLPSGTGMSAGFLGVLADSIDQMARLIPSD